jgi:SAM-dependent methyltransferase
MDAVERWLAEHPVHKADDLTAFDAEQSRLRNDAPLVTDASVDVIVSNCVLNLVSEAHKAQLFPEMYRVLKHGGRVIISDIVADEPVPQHLKEDPELWSGCISGAMTETAFLAACEQAGFHGIEVLSRQEAPWRTVEGIEFRSYTLRAFKGKEGPCNETNKAVMYRGPWKQVVDDDGHVLKRGERTAVCEKTLQLMMRLPYAGQLEAIVPRQPVAPGPQRPFDCSRKHLRHPRETKGMGYAATTEAAVSDCSGPDCC